MRSLLITGKARGMEGHESELQLGLGAAQSFYREMDEVLSTRESVPLSLDKFIIRHHILFPIPPPPDISCCVDQLPRG